jgi:hypothetical protein
MKDLIKQYSSGKNVLILFILTNIVYALMLTVTIPKVMAMAGGMKLLDMMPTGYSHEYVNKLFIALGEVGRNAYLYNQIPLDMIYPFMFGISSCLLLSYLFNKLGKSDTSLFYLCFIPLFSGLFDYMENLGIIAMLNCYPHNPDKLTHATNLFSILKSFSTTIYFIVLAITLVALGVKVLTNKNKSV